MHLMTAHQLYVCRAEYATFSYNNMVAGNAWQQIQRGLQTHFKVAQVAVIHANQRSGQFQRGIQFIVIMYFYQHRHAESVRYRLKGLHLRHIQRGCNQQNRIRAHRASLVYLVFVNDEILAQYRQFAGRSRLSQVICAALKKLLIGQYRQTCRAMLRIARSDFCGAEIRAQYPFARTGFLYFRNHGSLSCFNPGAYRSNEIPNRRSLHRLDLHRSKWL